MKSTLYAIVAEMLLVTLLFSSCVMSHAPSTIPPISLSDESDTPTDSTPATEPKSETPATNTPQTVPESNAPVTVPPQTGPESDEPETVDPDIGIPNPPSDDPEDDFIAEPVTPSCNGINEYNAFLKSIEFPANFLCYEQLKMFGSFIYFSCDTDLAKSQYYVVSYRDNAELSICTWATEDWNNSGTGKATRASADGITDIFTYPEKQTVLVSFVPGTYHYYIHGKLSSIIVQWGPRVIAITPPEVVIQDGFNLRSYLDPTLSDDTTTIIGRLFHLSTMEDALREIIAANPFQ